MEEEVCGLCLSELRELRQLREENGNSMVTASISRDLIEDLFEVPKVRSKYLDAPLLEERTLYMSHLLSQGVSTNKVKLIARVLLDTVELLNLREARQIHPREMAEAALKWVANHEVRKGKEFSNKTCKHLAGAGKKWLAFTGLLSKFEAESLPFDFLVKPYLDELELNDLAKSTIYQRRYHLSKFQEWLSGRLENFAELSPSHIDEYVNSRRAKGWGQRTLQFSCYIIRLFLRHCESRDSCRGGISRSMLMPNRIKADRNPRGPAWKDVRRMFKAAGATPADLTANAIVGLCSIYALRRTEVMRLRLTDFDWYNEIMTVRRAKGGRLQRFPLQYQVGEAILSYLKSARPRSTCPNLFTSIQEPIRPMTPSRIHAAVNKRMKDLGIQSRNLGPHALRHACATRLLDIGFPLNEIADFLGHRSLRAVSTYAKYNPRLLRSVAAFSLTSIQ